MLKPVKCIKGNKKGQTLKHERELFTDGVRHVLDWALQLNYYRLLLEEENYTVSSMVIQALCRDTGLRIASERGITKPLYLIPINPISNHWLKLYMESKSKETATTSHRNRCSAKEM